MLYQHRDRSKEARDKHEAHVRAKFDYFRTAEAAINAGPAPAKYESPIHAQAETAVCGTYSGWARHLREGTKPDRDCSDAQALYQRDYRARKVAA